MYGESQSLLGRNLHRWYQPGVGRYARPEPEWPGDYRNTNHYLYALTNPVNSRDPDGRTYNPSPAGSEPCQCRQGPDDL